jgi:integrase/recombinase XerC
MSVVPSLALVPFLGHGADGATAWSRLAPGERRRTALQAAREHDQPTLWSLTEAWLRTFGAAGAAVAVGTVRSYRCGVGALLAAWAGQDLLHPDPDAPTLYVRQLERRGLAPTTIQARVAAGRGLYAGLRWCRAASVDPFTQCHVPHDPTPAWDKRMPYSDDEVAALLQAAHDPCDAVLILLGAHAGLRAQECTDLCLLL